ncbi:MAG: helix-turn-helix domain-containing protein [Alphaproteobacteria bacterium]|nr:helix-turn-helix domain-containing protein [Alphaproteobacteria bacterium]
MTKKAFEKIAAGLRDAAAFTKGTADRSAYRIHVPGEVDVKAIRKKVKLSQTQFAAQFGFSPARIRDWEQGRSRPDGAIRAYLLVIERNPDTVKKALKAA